MKNNEPAPPRHRPDDPHPSGPLALTQRGSGSGRLLDLAAPCQDALKDFLADRCVSGLLYHTQRAKHLARAGFEVRRH